MLDFLQLEKRASAIVTPALASQNKALLLQRLYPDVSTVDKVQLWIILAGYSLSFLLHAGTLVMYKVRGQSFWLFRRLEDPSRKGKFVVPNGALIWVIAWTIFTAMRVSGSAYHMRVALYHDWPHAFPTLLYMYAAIPLIIGGWLSIASQIMVVSLAFNRQQRTLPPTWLMNILTFAFLGAFIIVTLTFLILGNLRLTHVFSSTRQVLALLDSAIAGTFNDATDLPRLLALSKIAPRHQQDFTNAMLVFQSVDVSIGLAAVVLYLPFFFAFVTRLNTAIKSVKGMRKHNETVLRSANVISEATDAQALRQHQQQCKSHQEPVQSRKGARKHDNSPLNKYRFLIAFAVAFLSYATGLITIGLYSIAGMKRKDPSTNAIATLVDGWINVIFGIIVGLALFVMACQREDESAIRSDDLSSQKESKFRAEREKQQFSRPISVRLETEVEEKGYALDA